MLQVEAVFPCSPGKAYGGVDCPSPAAHGHYVEQISMCSLEGADSAAADEA